MDVQDRIRNLLASCHAFGIEPFLTGSATVELQYVSNALHQKLGEVQAIIQLEPVLSAMSPQFEAFSEPLLRRLIGCLKILFEGENIKRAKLKDCTSLIIIGICVHESKFLDVISKPSQLLCFVHSIAPRLQQVISADDGVQEAIERTSIDTKTYRDFVESKVIFLLFCTII